MLRHNFDMITKEFSRDEVMKMSSNFLTYAEEITGEKLWRPNPTRLCGYCDFLSYCDSGRNFMNQTNLVKFGVRNWGD